MRKESSSLRGWAGPGSNPDSGCTQWAYLPTHPKLKVPWVAPIERGMDSTQKSLGPSHSQAIGRQLPGCQRAQVLEPCQVSPQELSEEHVVPAL